MSVKTVQAVINGMTYTLTLNASTGKYETTVTAPTKSSYTQTNRYYNVTITATDNAGNVTTKNATDSVLGSSLQLKVVEKVAPVQTLVSPTDGAVLITNKPTFTWTITDDDSGVNPDTIRIKIDSSEHHFHDIASGIGGCHRLLGIYFFDNEEAKRKRTPTKAQRKRR